VTLWVLRMQKCVFYSFNFSLLDRQITEFITVVYRFVHSCFGHTYLTLPYLTLPYLTLPYLTALSPSLRRKYGIFAALCRLTSHLHPHYRHSNGDWKLSFSSAGMHPTVPIYSRYCLAMYENYWFYVTLQIFALRHVNCRSFLLTYLLTYLLTFCIYTFGVYYPNHRPKTVIQVYICHNVICIFAIRNVTI